MGLPPMADAASRMRRSRALRRAGFRRLVVHVHHDVVDALTDVGRVETWSEADEIVLATAVETLLNDFAASVESLDGGDLLRATIPRRPV
jgi:hypothetical protein